MQIKYRNIQYFQQLQYWHGEGRSMPGYRFGYGCPYIGYLLGMCDDAVQTNNGYLDLEIRINERHPGLLEQLTGPHGWTVLKMLIARKAEALTDEENSHG